MKPSQIPLTTTTQNHVDIEDILQDLILLKDGSVCLVLEISAINFGLLSETEQDATIYAYAQLLNSLTFSIQIIISSKQKDISDYIVSLDKQLTSISSPLLRGQLAKYRDFVKTVVRQGNVLDKKFFISIPFSSFELGAGAAANSLSSLIPGSKPKGLPRPKQDIIERAITNLSPKRDHLVRLFARIGLRVRQLTTNELLQFFFDSYNRGQLGTKVNPTIPKQT